MPLRIQLLISCLCLLIPTAVLAEDQRCNNRADVVVKTNDPAAVAEVCLAALQAIEFLAGFDLPVKRTINFEIVEQHIDSHGYVAYGRYDSRSDTIQLMSYATILKSSAKPQMYGEPFDQVHYRGAIAHEVAHAVVQHNLKTRLLSTGPQEYLAHATQLAVMPEDRRAAVLQAMDVSSWESGDAISDIYMAIEPGKFAAKSYQHLTSMLEPLAFVEILLTSKWFYVYVP